MITARTTTTFEVRLTPGASVHNVAAEWQSLLSDSLKDSKTQLRDARVKVDDDGMLIVDLVISGDSWAQIEKLSDNILTSSIETLRSHNSDSNASQLGNGVETVDENDSLLVPA